MCVTVDPARGRVRGGEVAAVDADAHVRRRLADQGDRIDAADADLEGRPGRTAAARVGHDEVGQRDPWAPCGARQVPVNRELPAPRRRRGLPAGRSPANPERPSRLEHQPAERVPGLERQHRAAGRRAARWSRPQAIRRDAAAEAEGQRRARGAADARLDDPVDAVERDRIDRVHVDEPGDLMTGTDVGGEAVVVGHCRVRQQGLGPVVADQREAQLARRPPPERLQLAVVGGGDGRRTRSLADAELHGGRDAAQEQRAGQAPAGGPAAARELASAQRPRQPRRRRSERRPPGRSWPCSRCPKWRRRRARRLRRRRGWRAGKAACARARRRPRGWRARQRRPSPRAWGGCRGTARGSPARSTCRASSADPPAPGGCRSR